jgi:hypothetical protein
MLRRGLIAASLMLGVATQAALIVRPDFSEVGSIRAAQRLVAKGELVRVLLFPSELGGQNDRENVGYVTPAAAKERLHVIELIAAKVASEGYDKMTVTPDYRGESIVPTRITMEARHSTSRGTFERTIEIW